MVFRVYLTDTFTVDHTSVSYFYCVSFNFSAEIRSKSEKPVSAQWRFFSVFYRLVWTKGQYWTIYFFHDLQSKAWHWFRWVISAVRIPPDDASRRTLPSLLLQHSGGAQLVVRLPPPAGPPRAREPAKQKHPEVGNAPLNVAFPVDMEEIILVLLVLAAGKDLISPFNFHAKV